MSKLVRHLWIDRKLYLIPRSSKDILMLIQQVFRGIENSCGIITFDGKRYAIDNVDIFERFLINWLLAMVQSEESDPVLNDESEIPIELKIADNVPKKLIKEYSHEKKQ